MDSFALAAADRRGREAMVGGGSSAVCKVEARYLLLVGTWGTVTAPKGSGCVT